MLIASVPVSALRVIEVKKKIKLPKNHFQTVVSIWFPHNTTLTWLNNCTLECRSQLVRCSIWSKCHRSGLKRCRSRQAIIKKISMDRWRNAVTIWLTVLPVNWHSVAYSVNSFWMDLLMSTSLDSASATRSLILRVKFSNFWLSIFPERISGYFGWPKAAKSNESDDPLIKAISTVDSPVQLASNTR